MLIFTTWIFSWFYSGLTNYYIHFVYVGSIKSSNIDNTHIKSFSPNEVFLLIFGDNIVKKVKISNFF